MNLFKNKFVVIGLAVLAALLLVNSFKPLWQHGRPRVAPPAATAPKNSTAPGPVVAYKPPTPAPSAKTQGAEKEPAIDQAHAGWAANSAPRRDPFQIRQLPPGPTDLLHPPAMEVLRLSAIWRQAGGVAVAINDRVLTEGDTILDFKIQTIGSGRVWVEGPNGIEQLVFDYGGMLRSVSRELYMLRNSAVVGADIGLDWPYRLVNGITNDVKTAPWVVISGKVLQKLSSGSYLVAVDRQSQLSLQAEDEPVIVKNVPLDLSDKARLPPVRCKLVGNESYTATDGHLATKQLYDFGIPCAPPKEAVQSLLAQKVFLLQQYAEADAHGIELEIESARNGNPSAQYLLGQRYRIGEGVPKDEKQARHWLELSAAQANRDAQSALQTTGSQK